MEISGDDWECIYKRVKFFKKVFSFLDFFHYLFSSTNNYSKNSKRFFIFHHISILNFIHSLNFSFNSFTTS